MHILHLVNSYGGTEVYKNLFIHLDRLGVEQTVFVPLNAINHNRIGNHLIDFKVAKSRIIYSVDLKYYHRFLYHKKINTILRSIEKKIVLSEIDLVHAATLCVDGAVAFELKKKYKIPYLSAIRNTDISVYYKYFKWEKKYFHEIFKNSSNVIFICPQYKNLYIRKYCSLKDTDVDSEKVKIIPNGIDSEFLKDSKIKIDRKLSDKVRIVFASAFIKSKGLKEIIEAIALLRKLKGYDIRLEAVGKGLPFRKENEAYLRQIEELAHKYKWVVLREYVPKIDLMAIFKNSDIYVMPSKPETFGLVYVEALSQKLPLVYGKEQGFDGYFEDGFVGYAAEPFDIKDIARKIELVIDRYDEIIMHINSLDLFKQFSWENISVQYYNLYKKILNI